MVLVLYVVIDIFQSISRLVSKSVSCRTAFQSGGGLASTPNGVGTFIDKRGKQRRMYAAEEELEERCFLIQMVVQ